jgi:hypothetical protein
MMRGAKLVGCALYGALIWACALPRPLEVETPQAKAESYPLVIEGSAARQQAAEEAWALFLAEYRLPETKPDFEPVLFTPRALPAALSGRINLNAKGGPFGEAEAAEALRRFIEQARAILGGHYKDSSLSLKDLSLISLSNESNLYRAVYQQMNYPFPLANGYGELRLTISKAGALLQMSSRLAPKLELPARPAIEPAAVADKLLNREFTYTSIAGQPLRYKVAQREEISVKDLVVYPKLEKDKLLFYLAYPVEVGRGTTWTVYIDAIKGEEIDVKQNFAS